MASPLTGKRILLGITGSIAAYKAAEIVRELRHLGAEVKVLMTASAQRFVGPWTFRTLSGQAVISELFPEGSMHVPHIDLAEWADVLLIAPATANCLGKAAAGIADDLLSTVVLAARAPVCFAPAMNTNMLRHPAVVENMDTLRARGCTIIEPGEGDLACGRAGKGRLADQQRIMEAIIRLCSASTALAGKRVLVTAGRTEEPLDPVRFLSNPATGKMGYALAEAAQGRGATVTLVSGPSHLPPPGAVELIRVRTAEEMARVVFELHPACDILLMAAAVSDFRPKDVAPAKMKKGEAGLALALERTTDILAELAGRKEKRLHVGFALETSGSVEEARRKLAAKNLDVIVLNDLTDEGAGFGHETNVVTIIEPSGRTMKLPRMSKRDVAETILDRILELLNGSP